MVESSGALKISTPSEREIQMTRDFRAPAQLLFEAWTRPEFLKRWLHGPEGWLLVHCEMHLKVGGLVRMEWQHNDGRRMGAGGIFREIAAPSRLVHTEIFDEDWTGGETVVTLVFIQRAGTTTLTQTILYGSRTARDAALKTGMERGVAASFDRLEKQLETGGFREQNAHGAIG